MKMKIKIPDFIISGRGELMLEILLTQMRREGFEMTVSPPKVLLKKIKRKKTRAFRRNYNGFR